MFKSRNGFWTHFLASITHTAVFHILIIQIDACGLFSNFQKSRIEHHLDEVEIGGYGKIAFHISNVWTYSILTWLEKNYSERSISLEQVPENLPNLYLRLEAIGWICFSLEPCNANEQWVRNFMQTSWLPI